MSQFTGMNVGEVRQLAQVLGQKADEIESIMNDITGRLSGTQWVGSDRQRFEGDWNGQCCNNLRQVAQSLRDAQTSATKNADEQESASS